MVQRMSQLMDAPLPTHVSEEDVEELKQRIDDAFPFPDYREYQDEILYEIAIGQFIYNRDYMLVDAPTGIGKSPINVTLARLVSQHREWLETTFDIRLPNSKSYYTTPQKKLRNQLANDEVLSSHLTMLKGREDYMCGFSDQDCSSCPINSDPDASCRNIDGCTYWTALERAMSADVTAVTFARLIVDSYIPEHIEVGDPPRLEKISFGDRAYGFIDEAQGLDSQAASLFAGFTISPWTVPSEVWKQTGRDLDWDMDRYEHVEELVETLHRRAEKFIKKYKGLPEHEDDVSDCESFVQKVDYLFEEINEGRDWVVNIDQVSKPGMNGKTKSIELQPIDVDRFLQKFVFSRAKKWALTTATLPFRDNPEKFCEKLGIDPDNTAMVSRPMPFPKENRRIYTSTTVGKMKSSSEDENWNDAVQRVRELSELHDGEKGLIHTASYSRAKKLAESLNFQNLMVHESDDDAEELIERWQDSDKDMMISPSMMEGVDLYDDRCRWQAMLKVPYPNIGDSRWDFLLNERKAWDMYFESTSIDLIQSVGRGVRSPDDYCSYYVIDECWMDVMERVAWADWFKEAHTDVDPLEDVKSSTQSFTA